MPSESVKVIVRVRPMNGREKDKNCTNIVHADPANLQVALTNPAEPDIQKGFGFDAVFTMDSQQQTVYEEAAFQLVESVLEGYNGTIFAYGQTGCGKTHTMMGVPTDESLKGVIPRAFDHIFGNIKSSSQKNFLIRCSFIEIYNEEIHDLIGEDVRVKLDLKESSDKGIFIKNLSMHIVKSVAEIEKLMTLGFKNRSVGETAMNKDSSRSHSLFTIYVETSEVDPKGNPRITLGKLNLVDLAGSERQSKTGATGDRLKEANKINLSLSALGNVISALVDGKSSHIPYRDSKLTRLLQDSLGGNTKTVMIANVSPASDNYDETLGTLRYASRAKNIKNQPKVNQDPKDALLKEYAEEILRLKQMLEGGNSVAGSGAGNGTGNGSGNGAGNGAGASPGGKSGGGKSHNNQGGKKERKSVNETDEESSTTNLKLKKSDTNNLKNNYENQLKQKEDEINDERKKREELENKMKAMQQQLVVGGGAAGNGGKETKKDIEEKKKYQEMLQKLKDQSSKHEELLYEKAQKEEEVLLAEKKYSNLQEEVDEQRKIIKRLRKKYKDAVGEVKDLAREHELNKEDLLDTIRLLERDIKINNAIMAYLLSPEELEKIRAKARWHDDRNEFVVPPFVLRAKKVQFPKLGRNQAMDMVHEEWENREIEFTGGNYFGGGGGNFQHKEDEYGADNDWEEEQDYVDSGSYSPAKANTYNKDTRFNGSSNQNLYGKGDYHARTDSGANMMYDMKMAQNMAKNNSRDIYDARNYRDNPRGNGAFSNPPPQKKNMNKNVQLDPINQNHLTNKYGETPEKPIKAGSLVPLNNHMKGKAQLQPLNHLSMNNQKTMKLSFKATLLINPDGSNAELHNMTSHVKGY